MGAISYIYPGSRINIFTLAAYKMPFYSGVVFGSDITIYVTKSMYIIGAEPKYIPVLSDAKHMMLN
jgi:hypothetical protein